MCQISIKLSFAELCHVNQIFEEYEGEYDREEGVALQGNTFLRRVTAENIVVLYMEYQTHSYGNGLYIYIYIYIDIH